MAVTVLRRQVGKHAERVFTYKGEPVASVNTKAWTAALKRAGINDFWWHEAHVRDLAQASRNAHTRAAKAWRVEDGAHGRAQRPRSTRRPANGRSPSRLDDRVRWRYDQ